MPNQSAALDRMFHALGDPTRRAVVARLCLGSASVSDLAKPFPMALPSFVQHLKVLEDSGLIRSKKTGRVRTCEVNKKALGKVEDWLSTQRAMWEKRLDQLDDYLIKLKAAEKTR